MNLNEKRLRKIVSIEQKGTALTFILFPLLFISAQMMHGDIFQIHTIANGQEWINHFRGKQLLHFAHFIEFLCAFLLIVMAMHFKKILTPKSPLLVSIGVYMVFIGSLMLLANKSALCLTISGFDTLNDEQLMQIIPALDVLLQKRNFLSVLWLLPLLPIGYVLVGIALFRTKHVSVWQSTPVIAGSLMLANPEIPLINLFASLLLAGGLIPYGIKLLKTQKRLKERIL